MLSEYQEKVILEKVKKEALDKLDKVENYKKVKGGQTYEQTRNELFYSLPQDYG